MNCTSLKYLAAIACILAFPFCSMAQSTADTVKTDATQRTVITNLHTRLKSDSILHKDTVKVAKPKFQPNAKKAGLFSAIVPGLGQVYDRKYWKLPIIFAGAGASAYFINYN